MSETQSYPVVSIPTISEEDAHRLSAELYKSKAWDSIADVAMPFHRLDLAEVLYEPDAPPLSAEQLGALLILADRVKLASKNLRDHADAIRDGATRAYYSLRVRHDDPRSAG